MNLSELKTEWVKLVNSETIPETTEMAEMIDAVYKLPKNEMLMFVGFMTGYAWAGCDLLRRAGAK